MKSNSFLFRMAQKVPRSFRGRGIVMTVRFIMLYSIDRLFDIKYKTDTALQITLDELKIENSKKVYSESYNATHTVPLRKMFNRLKIEPGQVFVDLGCGKGRTLLIASEFGFKEARGIEFSDILCAIAKNNCTVYKAKTKTNTEFTVIESDVLDYRIKDDETVFYMFNPFKEYVLRKVLYDISASFQRKKRKILIIYCKPLYKDLIKEVMNPVRVLDFDSRNINTHFMVFEME
jgi:SAM-dependent methyltransferase